MCPRDAAGETAVSWSVPIGRQDLPVQCPDEHSSAECSRDQCRNRQPPRRSCQYSESGPPSEVTGIPFATIGACLSIWRKPVLSFTEIRTYKNGSSAENISSTRPPDRAR